MINPLLDEVRGIPARGPPKNYSEIQRQPLSPNEGSGSRRIEPSYGGSYGGIPRPQMEIRPTHDQNYNKNSYFETRSQETAKFKESVPFEQVQSEVRSHPETENQNGITLNQNIELESQKTVRNPKTTGLIRLFCFGRISQRETTSLEGKRPWSLQKEPL